MVVGVVVAVVEWCAAGGLAWFPWIWGGFRLVLGRNPANATSRGRRVRRVRGKVRAGLLASGAEVGPGGATPGRLSDAAGGEGRGGRGPRGWEFTPLRSPPWGVEKLGSVNMQPLNILIVAPGKR